MNPIMHPDVDVKVAKALQSVLDETNSSDPVELHPAPLIAIQRHGCSEARQAKKLGRPVQVAIQLKERYLLTPDEEVALLFREGECPKCHIRARSLVGRVVLTAERPPLQGRVARE